MKDGKFGIKEKGGTAKGIAIDEFAKGIYIGESIKRKQTNVMIVREKYLIRGWRCNASKQFFAILQKPENRLRNKANAHTATEKYIR